MRFKDQASGAGGRGGGGSATLNQKLQDLNLLQVTTQYSVVALCDSLHEASGALKAIWCHLMSCTRLILMLIKLRFDLGEDEAALLEKHFMFRDAGHGVVDNGWEDLIDMSLDYFIATTLVKDGHGVGGAKEVHGEVSLCFFCSCLFPFRIRAFLCSFCE